MCGIVGFIGQKNLSLKNLRNSIERLKHRGPDGTGITIIDPASETKTFNCVRETNFVLDMTDSDYVGVFAHSRFALVDLTNAGHQPFITGDDRICLVFNGEIYNYIEIRKELIGLGYKFSTNSDTEVLAKSYSCWGVDCFNKFVGFWAVILFDKHKQSYLVSRDRIGKAPLYYIQTKDGLYFSSEINALLELLPEFRSLINDKSVYHFATWSKRDFDNSTFFRSISTFPAASYSYVNPKGGFNAISYWSIPNERKLESEISEASAIEEFQYLISEATRIRIRADAPVSVQLSGGMDSSTLMVSAARHTTQLDVYTVRYGYGKQDEEPIARQLVNRYSKMARYNVIEPPEKNLLEDLTEHSAFIAEPFHSPSLLVNQAIWRIMRKNGFRAVLYGGGGDEVFAGYSTEYFAPYLRTLIGKRKYHQFVSEFFKFSEYKNIIDIPGYAKMVGRLLGCIPRRANLGRNAFVPSAIDPLVTNSEVIIESRCSKYLDERLLEGMSNWGMNYWLRVDNQNSMGVPIELRMPFLDHRVIEFAFKLPLSFLIRNGWHKWIVRKAMEDKLPNDIVWRKVKMGYPFPLFEWLSNNQKKLAALLGGSSCPYIDMKLLFRNFDNLNQLDSPYLWNLVSIGLWWENSIQRNY